jgi:ABC-type Fe3+/spermidine/putrescine transport system ATPase subunit
MSSTEGFRDQPGALYEWVGRRVAASPGAHGSARTPAAAGDRTGGRADPEPRYDAPMLEIVNAVHRYQEVTALKGVSLVAGRGEFLTILGESGSGKTTLLKIVSGLERPTSVDRLAIDGVDVSQTPASKRNCTTVFQNYALFPHMSVRENVEYGLRVRKVPLEERHRRAGEALALVRLAEKHERRVHQLSGGEKQRVALARALVTQPAILLLDEPIGALDEKLRQEMQLELVQLQRKLGVTFIYVTHSQEEALTMSDRIILMRAGEIVQEGPPLMVFDRPATRFVAEFMGMDNVIEVPCAEVAGDTLVGRIGEHSIRGRWCGGQAPRPGERICFGVRAELVQIGTRPPSDDGAPNVLPCRAEMSVYRGKYVDHLAISEAGPIKVRVWDKRQDLSDFQWVWWSVNDSVAFPNGG